MVHVSFLINSVLFIDLPLLNMMLISNMDIWDIWHNSKQISISKWERLMTGLLSRNSSFSPKANIHDLFRPDKFRLSIAVCHYHCDIYRTILLLTFKCAKYPLDELSYCPCPGAAGPPGAQGVIRNQVEVITQAQDGRYVAQQFNTEPIISLVSAQTLMVLGQLHIGRSLKH